MIPCLVIGDSIAVGVGSVMPECRVEAKVGISSRRFIQQLLAPKDADTVVISLGVNDGPSTHTIPNLLRVREEIRGRHVYWLLPPGHAYTRTAIQNVAARFGDRLIDCAPVAGPDGLHPTGVGYRALGAQIRR